MVEPLEPPNDIETHAAENDAAFADYIAGEVNKGDDETAKLDSKLPQSAYLTKLAHERYAFGCSSDGEPFAVDHEKPGIAISFRGNSASLRAELALAYHEAYGKPPNSSALADALRVLEGVARREEREDVHLRIAPHDHHVVLDLGGESGHAVVIEPNHWKVVDQSPALFRRTALTGRLPAPDPEGDIDGLRSLVNLNAEQFDLLVGVLVAALIPSIPHPIPLFLGEQGTAKTSLVSCASALIDPTGAQVRGAPSQISDWLVAAAGSWIVPLDNISTVQPWLSDALCRAVTGEGLVKRRLYSDADLSVLSFRRCVFLTSIDPGPLRGDLADRLVIFELARISDRERRDDDEVRAQFRAAHPVLLGGLLNLLAEVLAVLPTVHLGERPRMADFAKVLAAVDIVRGTDALGLYLSQADDLAERVADSDPVASALIAFVREQGEWEGTMSELLEVLTPEKSPAKWPKSVQAMVGALSRLAPSLRQLGIGVEQLPRTANRRPWRLTHQGVAKPTSPTSPTSPRHAETPSPDDNPDAVSPDEPAIVIAEPLVTASNDDGDDHDDLVTTPSLDTTVWEEEHPDLFVTEST